MVLVYHWSSGVIEQHDPLIGKPVSRWTPEDVVSWLNSIGPWAQLYRDRFQQENVNGRFATRHTKPKSGRNFTLIVCVALFSPGFC